MIDFYDAYSNFFTDTILSQQLRYPNSSEFEMLTRLSVINLDKRREDDLIHNNGFIVGPTEGNIKKDLKSPVSIFSSKYGASLKDLNSYIDKFKCDCESDGLTGQINEGKICPKCGGVVRNVTNNFDYCGYIVLKRYWIIHPNMYKKLSNFIGATTLDQIIKYDEKRDVNGHIVDNPERTKDKPFYGIGMIQFRERFNEILDFYANRFKKKDKQLKNILKDKDKIFTQSIPVYTTYLRPIEPTASTLAFESTNSYYYVISTVVSRLNDVHHDMRRNIKDKNDLLYDIQLKLMELYKSIVKIISTKKGDLRKALSGRCNFTGRNVIRQDITLDIDQVKLSYYSLVELLQQRIINILKKLYNYSYFEAYNVWWKSQLEIDPKVVNIIDSLIKGSYMGLGLPVLVNRNPTIAFGGILQMFVVGMTFDHTMCVPLRTLKLFAGDFDGVA